MARLIRSPEISELRSFCLAADLGSVNKAAHMLGVSQPALSKRLQVLETLAGKPLLKRSTRGVSLTPSGARLYIEARKLLAQADAIDDLMGTAAPEAPIRLATSHTIAEFVLPALLVDFEAQNERHLALELLIGNSDVVRQQVSDGHAEVGIVAAALDASPSNAELSQIPFLDDEIVVMVPRAHQWCDLEQIPLASFLNTPLIVRDPRADSRRTVEHALDAQGLSLAAPVAEMGSTSAIMRAALTQNVAAMLSCHAAPLDEFVMRRVKGLRFKRRFVMVFGTAEEHLPPATRTLAQYLLAHRPARA